MERSRRTFFSMNLFRAVRFSTERGVLYETVSRRAYFYTLPYSLVVASRGVCVCAYGNCAVKNTYRALDGETRLSPDLRTPYHVSARTVRPSVDAASAYGSSGFSFIELYQTGPARAIVSSPDRQRACATTRLLSRSGQKSSILCGGACLRSPAGVWADRGGGSLRAITICGCARRERGRRIRF